jgi:hypothetical protein
MENSPESNWYNSQKTKVIEGFIEELTERATNPNDKTNTIQESWPVMIKEGKKIPANRESREALIKIAQDHRLTPDQIDQIISELLE